MAKLSMVTVEIDGRKHVMTPEDASHLADRIKQDAIKAAGENGILGEGAPSFGDFYIDKPTTMIRVEQGDDGKSVALVARGNKRPHVWLWYDAGDAEELANGILEVLARSAIGQGQTLALKLHPGERR